jgi:predicted MFS family arabinose efflux permease
MTTAIAAEARIVRGRATWYGYLILAFFTFALNIQGNILPFLKADLGLSYRTASLHSSAVAAGMIFVGLFGNRIIGAIGRRAALLLGAAGVVVGGVILSQAGFAWLTIASCALIGTIGALIPATVFALLPDLHGANRDIAYSEVNAVCYAFAILAPLATGFSIAVGLGWRNAVLFGMALGAIIALFNFSLPIPEPRRGAGRLTGRLPAAFWIYWSAICLSCSIEFCTLLWAPSFLEQVGGLSEAAAATCAAAFSLAMLGGRTFGGPLIRRYSRRLLVVGSVVMTLAGFIVYWGLGDTIFVVPGLFAIGLGVSLLYPLNLGLAIGAAGKLADAASARTMLAVGIAVLTMPALLGALADAFGLRSAHLMIPVLVLLALGCFSLGQAMERRGPGLA